MEARAVEFPRTEAPQDSGTAIDQQAVVWGHHAVGLGDQVVRRRHRVNRLAVAQPPVRVPSTQIGIEAETYEKNARREHNWLDTGVHRKRPFRALLWFICTAGTWRPRQDLNPEPGD